jgi:hypothetical protein
VTTINFEARSVAALMHHPFRPLLVGVDGTGFVRVYSTRHSTFVNSFSLAADRPTSVVSMWQLNEAQVRVTDSMLLYPFPREVGNERGIQMPDTAAVTPLHLVLSMRSALDPRRCMHDFMHMSFDT